MHQNKQCEYPVPSHRNAPRQINNNAEVAPENPGGRNESVILRWCARVTVLMHGAGNNAPVPGGLENESSHDNGPVPQSCPETQPVLARVIDFEEAVPRVDVHPTQTFESRPCQNGLTRGVDIPPGVYVPSARHVPPRSPLPVQPRANRIITLVPPNAEVHPTEARSAFHLYVRTK